MTVNSATATPIFMSVQGLSLMLHCNIIIKSSYHVSHTCVQSRGPNIYFGDSTLSDWSMSL